MFCIIIPNNFLFQPHPKYDSTFILKDTKENKTAFNSNEFTLPHIQRAKILADKINQIAENIPPIYISSLGCYLENMKVNYPREVIIVGILREDKGVKREQAIYKGLLKWYNKKTLRMNIRKFSRVFFNEQGGKKEIPLTYYVN